MKTTTNSGSWDPRRRRMALVAHDNKKAELLDWAEGHRALLEPHELFATGTTGRMLIERLDLDVTCLHSGPLGGDQQIGAMIAEGRIDVLIFLWDPLEPQPHDPDVRALLRIAAVWNIPVASNLATADHLLCSPLLTGDYERLVPVFESR